MTNPNEFPALNSPKRLMTHHVLPAETVARVGTILATGACDKWHARPKQWNSPYIVQN